MLEKRLLYRLTNPIDEGETRGDENRDEEVCPYLVGRHVPPRCHSFREELGNHLHSLGVIDSRPERSRGLSVQSLKQRNSVEVHIPRQKNGTVLESRCGYPDVIGGDRCPLPSEESNQVAVAPRDSVFDRNKSYTTLAQEQSELVLILGSSYSAGKSGVQLTENNGRYDYLNRTLE